MVETKKQQITKELQHIEERIKRNFDNRNITKSDGLECGEHELQDTEEQFEDVTESQVVIPNVCKNSNDLSTNERTYQEQIINELGGSFVQNSTVEETKSVSTDNSGEELSNPQVNFPSCELQDETKNIQNVCEQDDVFSRN